jgi:arabinose-5-phosphate isomerase
MIVRKAHRYGIGKSAIIAQKIVATFNSTGCPAIFIHAADAIHDLGIIQKEDIVLVLSKSGDSPEIKVLTPYLKSMGNKVIGMVSNKNSVLAYEADITLFLPVEKKLTPIILLLHQHYRSDGYVMIDGNSSLTKEDLR